MRKYCRLDWVIVVKETESCKVLQIGTSDSQVHSTSGEISRHSASDRRKYDEQTYSASKLTSIEELVEKHTTRLITDVQENVLQVGLTGNVSGEINTSQLSLGATSQTGAQQVNEVEHTSDLQLSVTSPTFQSIEGKSSDSELESSIFRTSTGSEVDGYGGYSQPQATRLSSFDETNQSGIRFAEESSLVDAISSVERMHESSSQIVHEFVQKTRHDSSVSETKPEKESSNDSLLGEAGLVKRDSGLVSESSGTKGLSDNMWDAKDHSVDEVSESESELRDAEISKNDVARRTGRSLWNIVDGLFRLRWRSISETQKSPVKSNQQRSSYDSASAETWFSGNEHDEGMKRVQITLSQEPTSSDQPSSMITPSRSRHGDRKKKQSISMPPETTSELPLAKESASKSRKKDRRKKEEPALDQSLHRKTTNKSQKGDARLTSLDDRLGPVELHVSSFASTAQGGLVSGSVSIGAKTDLEITQQTSHPSPISPFVPSFGRLRRSGALKENEQ
ncbi:hypothetical protein RND81_02G201600 [Saponaria officinalis]|uniref:Uncharacterized protein n=1 Tax=Saponaria officinalis TaxID=3572 RepID=A0AAW1MNC2_SAPOF